MGEITLTLLLGPGVPKPSEYAPLRDSRAPAIYLFEVRHFMQAWSGNRVGSFKLDRIEWWRRRSLVVWFSLVMNHGRLNAAPAGA